MVLLIQSLEKSGKFHNLIQPLYGRLISGINLKSYYNCAGVKPVYALISLHKCAWS